MSAFLPPDLYRNRRLNQWIQFRNDGTIGVRSGKVDIGQGITSALAQIAAEELDVDYRRICMIPADTVASPDEGVTAGSKSIEMSGNALRYACAEIRSICLDAAAIRLQAATEQLFIEDGTIKKRDSNQSTNYWELSEKIDLAQEARGGVVPKSANELKIVGKPLQRLDIPAKVTGAAFVHDLDLPGMFFGRILRPPSYRASLVSYDATSAKLMPGVRAIVREGRFIGVVTEREEQAIATLKVLERNTAWSEEVDLPDEDKIPDFLLAQHAEIQILSEKLDQKPEAQALSAVYSRPFLSHGSIGPSCAVACTHADSTEVWCHSQSIYPLRKDIAKVLGCDPAQVIVHHVEGSGCYGHNGADDAALDAVLLSQAVPGHPVKVQWMREDEFGWEPFGPAMVVKIDGALNGSGNIVRWRHELWSNAHIMRPGLQESPSLLAAWHLDRGFAQPDGVDALVQGEIGASQRNAIPLYTFPNQQVIHHVLPPQPLRTSTLRSIGAHANVFAIESFMDELACAAGIDPVVFRLNHLNDERAREVVRVAANLADLGSFSQGDGVRGMGMGFARYNNEGCYAAVVVEIEVDESIRVLRAVAALDCGRAVNSDGASNQAEGGIVQAASWTLKERVRFDRTRITSRTWDDYPILRFSEIPSVETVIIDRPSEPSVGMGEGLTGPTAAAIGNALFNAIGLRVRDLPITRERILSMINGS